MIRNKKKLTSLNHTQYEHPFDKKALETLEGTTGLAVAGRYVTKQTIERVYTVQYTALLSWDRMSEFTADRAGLLCCQNADAAIRVFPKSAGLPQNQFNRLNEQAFLQQAKDFDTLDYEKMNKFFRFISIVDSSHPWTVMRAAELVKWIERGDYYRLSVYKYIIRNIMKMKKLVYLVLTLFLAIGTVSCRNANQAKQAMKVAKSLSGKVVKASKKSKVVLQYGDDVFRNLDFVKENCTARGGNGVDNRGRSCEDCEGHGYVYRIKMK